MKSNSKQDAINAFVDNIENKKSSFVKGIIDAFNREEETKEKAPQLLFRELPVDRSDLRATLIKVACLNDMYSTRLNTTPPSGPLI